MILADGLHLPKSSLTNHSLVGPARPYNRAGKRLVETNSSGWLVRKLSPSESYKSGPGISVVAHSHYPLSSSFLRLSILLLFLFLAHLLDHANLYTHNARYQ